MLWLSLLLVLTLPAMPASGPEGGAVVEGSLAPSPESVPAFAIDPVADEVLFGLAGLATAWSLFLAWRTLSALVALRRLKRQCRPFPVAREARLMHWMAVRDRGRRARLAISDHVSSAAALGISLPVIALAPSLLDSLCDDDLDRIVIHEWAHVQRRDDVTNLLQVLTRAAVGWHPGVWWIDRQLQSEREAACDERAIAMTGSARDYAACLARLAEMRGSTTAALLAPGAAHAPAVTGRILRALARKGRPSLVRSATTGAAAIITLTIVSSLVSGVTLVVMRPAAVLESMVAPAAAATNMLTRALAPAANGSAARLQPRREKPTADRHPAPAASSHRPANTVGESAPRLATMTVSTQSADNSDMTPNIAGAPALPSLPPSGVVPLASAPGDQLAQPAAPPGSAQQQDTPWGAAADTGVAVARGSQRAAVATAGFFSRLGKKVAKSF
jgi:beta-lactamase regulating signal transducer with metallopeptidase domain